MMQMTGEHMTDIKLDDQWQPVADGIGDAGLVSDDECWMQDLRLEALTEEKELFYEDEDESYGYGLSDFLQQEYDEFTEAEIQQRIRDKLAKRTYIDAATIRTAVKFDGEQYNIKISFQKNDQDKEYNMELTVDKVEVSVE